MHNRLLELPKTDKQKTNSICGVLNEINKKHKTRRHKNNKFGAKKKQYQK